MYPFTRRKLLTGAVVSALAPLARISGQISGQRKRSDKGIGFLDVIRHPDAATGFMGVDHPVTLKRSATSWQAPQVNVRVTPAGGGLLIYISASSNTLTHVQLRWSLQVAESLLVMGDAWERSYGDLRWSGMIPERVLPWYFMTSGDGTLHGYGVKTGPSAFCFWQLDPDGVSLWLDVANGGSGVALGDRELLAATVVTHQGANGEDPIDSAREFCRMLCDKPRLPSSPIFGSNDWYYAYGKNSAEQILRDADLMASVAPANGPRPFTVIDDGWTTKSAFPDMAELARGIRERNVRPGCWSRPLQASAATDSGLRLP